MILTLNWTAPSPVPSCGYKAFYRRKGDITYTSVPTSGTTLAIVAPVSASYEGYIQSDCCSENLSTGDPFGTNAYSPMSVFINVNVSPLKFKVNMSTLYPTAYDTVIGGTFRVSTSGTTDIPFSAYYAAGQTFGQTLLSSPLPASAVVTVSNVQVTSIVPAFNNGGELQQFDPVLTPKYFEVTSTSGQTSGTTLWTGEASDLPSFTLDSFNVTETDSMGNVLAGDLTVSWAQGVLYGGGAYPYDLFRITISDDGITWTYGVITYSAGPNGLRTLTIPMVGDPSNLITAGKRFFYKTDFVAAGGVGTGKYFYLPDF